MLQADVTTSGSPPGMFEAMWVYRWLVVTLTALVALAGLAWSLAQRPRYVATASLILSDTEDVGLFHKRGTPDPERRLLKEAEFIRSSTLSTRVSANLGGRLTPAGVADRVSVQASSNLDLLFVSANGPTAEAAAELANAVAQAYQQVSLEEGRKRAQRATEMLERYGAELQATVAQAEQKLRERRLEIEASLAGTAFPTEAEQLDAIEERVESDPVYFQHEDRRAAALNELRALRSSVNQYTIDAAVYGMGVDHYEPAPPPMSPASPRPLSDTALAAVVGLVLSTAIAWNRLDRDAQHEAERLARAPADERPAVQLSLS